MAEVPDIIKSKIESFLKCLENNNIRIKKAFLFGSYAKGKNDNWSDIDLAVISDDFTGNRLKTDCF